MKDNFEQDPTIVPCAECVYKFNTLKCSQCKHRKTYTYPYWISAPYNVQPVNHIEVHTIGGTDEKPSI